MAMVGPRLLGRPPGPRSWTPDPDHRPRTPDPRPTDPPQTPDPRTPQPRTGFGPIGSAWLRLSRPSGAQAVWLQKIFPMPATLSTFMLATLSTFICFFTGADRQCQRLKHQWERFPKHIYLTGVFFVTNGRTEGQGDSRSRIYRKKKKI